MRNVFRKLINILAPDNIKCIACDTELNQDNKYGLCPKCLAKIPTINKSCHKCGREIYDQGKYCFDYKEGGFYFDRVYACLNYEDFVHGIVYKLKYGKAKYLAPFIARVIADKIIEEDIKFEEIYEYIQKYFPKLKCLESVRGEYYAIHIYFGNDDNFKFQWELQLWDKKHEKTN